MSWESATAALRRGWIVVRMVLVVIVIDGRTVLGGLLITPDAGDWNVGLAGRGDFEVSSGPGPRAGEVVKRIYTAGVADCVQA